MKRERVRKGGAKSIGVFILGWFVGFLCTVLILAGIGYWAYNNVSIKKVENWSKSNITDNESLENKTIKDWVAIISAVNKTDTGAYTLAKFEEDFNIKIFSSDKMFGFDITKLKNSPIKELRSAIEDTVNNTTFTNILSFMEIKQEDLGMLNTVLNSEITYYVSNGKLYEDDALTKEVKFSYTITGENIEIANGTYPIVEKSGKTVVEMCLSNLPIETAMMNIEDATKDLEIWEILGYTREGKEGNYVYKDNGVEVTGILKNMAGKTINQLSNSETFDEIYIYEVLGFTRSGEEGNYTYTDNGVEVTGILKTLAGKTIKDMSNNETFEKLYLYEVFGYTREGGSGNYIYKDNGVEVTGVLRELCGKTVKELSNNDTYTDLKVCDVLDYTLRDGKYYDKNNEEVKGVLKVLANKTIGDLSNNDTFTSLKVYEILDYTREGTEGNYTYKSDGKDVTGIMKALADSSINEIENKIKTMQMWEILGYTREETEGNYTYKNGENAVTGIMKALADSTVDNIQSKIDSMQMWEIMGYTREGIEGNYTYKNGENEVTGIMKILAEQNIDTLSGRIDTLEVWEVLGYTREGEEGNYIYKDGENEVTGIMKALAGSKINDLGTDIDALKAKDVFDRSTTKILNLFTDEELENLTVMDMPNQVVEKMNSSTTTIGKLIDAEIIVVDGEVSETVRAMTVKQLIEYASSVT